MDIIVFGVNEITDSIIKDSKYNVLMLMDNDFHRCNEGYNGYSIIHPIDLRLYSYDGIVLADDILRKDDIYRAYEKRVQLTLYGVNVNEKVYVFLNHVLVPIQAIQSKFPSEDIIGYQSIFKTVHPKSILNTHTDYVLERCNKRKLYIYGIGYEAICLTRMLDTMNIRVTRYINDNSAGKTLNSVNIIGTIDLVYEDPEEVFIIIADETESYGITREKLLNLGMKEDVDFTYHSEIPGTNEPFYFDVTLSYSRIRQSIEGFELFGDIDNPDALAIVVLGGSTTESQLFFVKGWVPFFAEYLNKKGIASKVYCGGVSGYTSTQELLKLQRDVIGLSPDIVISYSGVNDLYMFPSEEEKERWKKPFITKFQVQFINQVLEKLSRLDYSLPTPDIPEWEKGGRPTVFYGLESAKTAGPFWVDNMRMMNALCKEFGITFFSFFQPFRFNGYYTSTPTQSIIHARRDPSCIPPSEGQRLYSRSTEVEEVRSSIRKYSYIKDLTELFELESDVYYDSVHVYEKGNKIIARRICEEITTFVDRKGKSNNAF